MNLSKQKSFLLFITSILIFTLALVGCGSSEPVPPPIEPTPTPDPAAIAAEAGASMSTIDSVQFTIERTGGPAFVDANSTLAINSAVGAYQAPDSVGAEIDVTANGSINVKVQTIAIGEEQWLTNFLTGQWEMLPEGIGFNPAIIFSTDVGLEPILAENLVSASMPRRESLDGTDYDVMDVEIEGERVAAITAGTVVSDEPVALELWIDPATNYIHRIVFETASSTEEASQWALTFTNFNDPVTIEAP